MTSQPVKRKAPPPPPAPSPSKRGAFDKAELPSDLGELIVRDALALKRLGWHGLVSQRRPTSDFSSLDNLPHPARRLLRSYAYKGAPVKFSTPPWTRQQLEQASKRGPHRSALQYIDFLHEEFVDMINKGEWIVLPAKDVLHLPGLRLSPPGVVPQRGRRPRWIGDYSWWGINEDTLPLAAMESMQFGHALDRILREILFSSPKHGPVHMIKLDLKDGFYRIGLIVDDIPKLGVIFPTLPGEEPLIAFPLVLPMGWKNSPPIFCTATETIADIANARINTNFNPPAHHLDELAESIPPPAHESYQVLPASSTLPQPSTTIPARDPSLPTNGPPTKYVDIYVDDFVGLAQTPQQQRVRRILLGAIDEVFRPLSSTDAPTRQEPVSVKKLREGDGSWSTIKSVLGWIIDSEALTISLPPHRVARLKEILDEIPSTQRRISVKKWHKILGELRSMSLALPGARYIFSSMQNAFSSSMKGRLALDKGVHHALDDFRWIHDNISTRPTRIAELVPLPPVAEGHHDASGHGAGGIWFPSAVLPPREGIVAATPVVWRYEWPPCISSKLKTDKNPTGTISNSDLELAGGLIHLECISQCYDVRERTVLSKGDNLSTTFWERKGSTSTNSPPAYLLRQFGMHQRFHRYVPRFDYISGPSNPIADSLSRKFSLNWTDQLSDIIPFIPQHALPQVWTPSKHITSAVISALLRRQSNRESLRVEPKVQSQLGPSGKSSQVSWASTPFSKPTATKYSSYKSSPYEFNAANYRPVEIPSGLDRLKITYGTLRRRSSTWGPKIHASTRLT